MKYFADFQRELADPMLVAALVKRFANTDLTNVKELSANRLKYLLRFGLKVGQKDGLTESSPTDVGFLVKYRGVREASSPSTVLLNRDCEGTIREAKAYQLLAGIHGVPRAYLLHDILLEAGVPAGEVDSLCDKFPLFKRSLILEDAGSTTLKDKLSSTSNGDRSSRKKIIAAVFPDLVTFQRAATTKYQARRAGGNGIGDLFQERSMRDKMLDYIRGILRAENTEDLPPEVIQNSEPVIELLDASYNHSSASSVCHGDFIPQNIVDGGNRGLYFIDPQLKWRDPLIDAISLLAAPGVLLTTEDREDLARAFKLEQIRSMGVIGRGLLGSGRLDLDQKGEKALANDLHTRTVQYASRNLAILNDLERQFPGVYRGNPVQTAREMKQNLKSSLEIMMAQPEKIGISQADARAYDNFYKTLKQEGVFDLDTDPVAVPV